MSSLSLAEIYKWIHKRTKGSTSGTAFRLRVTCTVQLYIATPSACSCEILAPIQKPFERRGRKPPFKDSILDRVTGNSLYCLCVIWPTMMSSLHWWGLSVWMQSHCSVIGWRLVCQQLNCSQAFLSILPGLSKLWGMCLAKCLANGQVLILTSCDLLYVGLELFCSNSSRHNFWPMTYSNADRNRQNWRKRNLQAFLSKPCKQKGRQSGVEAKAREGP